MGICTYKTLYGSYVVLILNYGAAIWGFSDFNDGRVLQNRIIWYYMDIHKWNLLPVYIREAPINSTALRNSLMSF